MTSVVGTFRRRSGSIAALNKQAGAASNVLRHHVRHFSARHRIADRDASNAEFASAWPARSSIHDVNGIKIRTIFYEVSA
jgi:hypothetical protein